MNPNTDETVDIAFGYQEEEGFFFLVNEGEQYRELNEELFLSLWRKWQINEDLIQ